MKYKAVVNEEYEFSSSPGKAIDILPEGEDRFHIIADGVTYHATLRSVDWEKKIMEIQINGQYFKVRLEDEFDQLVDQLGLKVNSQFHLKDIKAPMPGLVLKVEVKEGQEVEPGAVFLILEAMKMENVIRASAAGKVKKLHAKAGEAVEKGQLLIEIE